MRGWCKPEWGSVVLQVIFIFPIEWVVGSGIRDFLGLLGGFLNTLDSVKIGSDKPGRRVF